MGTIFLGFIISISIVVRSFDGFVTNKKVLSKVELIHKSAKQYIIQILKSTFETASKGILLSSFQYLIYFGFGIFFLSTIVFGLSEKIAKVNVIFISGQLKAILTTIFLLVGVKFGLKYNLKEIKVLIKDDLLSLLKSHVTWIIFLLIYVVIVIMLMLFIEINKKIYGISKEDLLTQVIISNSGYELVNVLGFPIIILLGVIICLSVIYLVIWILSRGMSFVSYWLLKSVFSISFHLNKKKPLKPTLIILQVFVIILTPCLSLVIEVFEK